ncbi:predicted protein [Naegleria gruberi]|uniref:Predicted protein n=1 Tax=Naegleria gruberi TaxID=5762 RepID=D2VN07_NAEGR|nr:uncharacterized protein NAEGRDRAFT_70329 [Naegleria gruberi]EFC41835.1 predicted protein [Naegleria gruberi]|eukprot:XP_002674579.1 predicted protein [Naegleria gruberi strain NEG-M]
MYRDLNALSYSKIKDEKYVRFLPNTAHYMFNTDVLTVLGTFYISRLNNAILPKYNFSHEYVNAGVVIYVSVSNGIKPSSVKVWNATNPFAHDFRTSTIGSNVWQNQTLIETQPLVTGNESAE